MSIIEGFYALPLPQLRHGRLSDRPAAPTARQQAFIDWQEPALYVAGSDMAWQKISAAAGENLGDGADVFAGVSEGVLQFRAITAATPLLAVQNELTVDLGLNVGSAGGVQAWSANLDAWSALATSAKANTAHTHAASDIVSGTLPVVRGGTGASSAAGARTELGLLIGTDVQAYSANLTAWADLATSAKADAVHTHAASAIVSGTLATARGGLGADVSSGAAGQVLVRSSLNGHFGASDLLLLSGEQAALSGGLLILDRAANNPVMAFRRAGADIVALRGNQTDSAFDIEFSSTAAYRFGTNRTFEVFGDGVTGRVLVNRPGASPLGSVVQFGAPGSNPGLILERGDGAGGVSSRWDIFVNSSQALSITRSGTVGTVLFQNLSLSHALDVTGTITSNSTAILPGIKAFYRNVSDDSVTSLVLPSVSGVVMLWTDSFAKTALIAFRTNASATPSIILQSGGSTLATSTAILTGTTGTDGNITFSAVASNNTIYIENRTGVLRAFGITVFA